MSDLFQTIAEKAESKKQQRLMGMVRAVQKGEMKSPSETVAKLAQSMKKKDVKDFASTKHDGLPEKKKVDEGFKQMPGRRMADQRDRLEGKAKDLEKGRKTKKKSERAAKYKMQSNAVRNAGLQDYNAKGESYSKAFHHLTPERLGGSKFRKEETEINEAAPMVAAIGRKLLAKAAVDKIKKMKEKEEEETEINEIAPALAAGAALGIAAGGAALVKKAAETGKAMRRNAERRMGKEPVKESAWQRKEGKNPSGGLNEKGRKSYERENPGSDLKAPQPEGGPRKRSFCARMGGMEGPMKDEKGRPTRKALALRKWKCP